MSGSVTLRLLLVLVGSLLLGIATVPAMKVAVEQALPGPEWVQDLTRYQAPDGEMATWDVGRASRRWLALVTLVLFLALRRTIPWRDLARRGLRRSGRGAGLRFGLAAGLGAGTLYVLMLLASGDASVARPDAAGLAGRVVEYAAGAAIIGLVEELFFRGILFRAMLRDWGTWPALLGSSAVFALLHAISGGLRAGLGWQPWLGFELLATYYTVDGSPWPDVRLMVGLLLLGILLCKLYLRTGSLWAPIGLHAAVVCVTRLSKKILDRSPDFPEWLLGDPVFLVSGVAVWAVLIGGILLLPRLAPAGPLARRRQRAK